MSMDGAVMEHGLAPGGFRMPGAMRIGAVRLQVASVERSLAWYGEVLGFRVANRAPGRAALAAQGNDAVLVELHERAGASPAPGRGRLGLYHFAVLLPDRAALGRLVRHLADRGEGAGASDHLVSEALYLNDPDGLGIEVYADRPRDTWRYDGPQLRMSTLPLNTAALAQAAGDAPWTGMPAGTTIGHVHLHVGGIDEAAAFYHHGLGLDRVVWGYPGALFLSAGGYHHHLGLNTWAGPGARPAGDGDARLLSWDVVAPDADAAAASLASAGFAPERGEGAWTARDPWGTAVRIVSG